MHSSPGKFPQARKGCRRIHLWGVNQGGKGLQGRGYVRGSHVTGKEAHSPAGDRSADPRAALPSPCGLAMHPPVADTVPLLTGRHPEVGTSSAVCGEKVEVVSLSKTSPWCPGWPRALCFPPTAPRSPAPTVQDPTGGTISSSPDTISCTVRGTGHTHPALLPMLPASTHTPITYLSLSPVRG